MKLIAPNGKDIVGTADFVPGTCFLHNDNVTQRADGTYEFAYADETKMDWDGQETRVTCGQRVFVDSDGKTWLERELKLVEEVLKPVSRDPWMRLEAALPQVFSLCEGNLQFEVFREKAAWYLQIDDAEASEAIHVLIDRGTLNLDKDGRVVLRTL